MDQDPPPTYQLVPGTSSQYQGQYSQGPLPPKCGYPQPITTAPMQAVYVANPGYVCQPGYPQQNVPVMASTVTRAVVQQQPPVVLLTPGLAYRDVPVSLQCHVCKTQIITATEHHPGSMSLVICCALASFGCIFGCCLIPFVNQDCQDVTHSCPNCKTILGEYRRW